MRLAVYFYNLNRQPVLSVQAGYPCIYASSFGRIVANHQTNLRPNAAILRGMYECFGSRTATRSEYCDTWVALIIWLHRYIIPSLFVWSKRLARRVPQPLGRSPTTK